MSDETCCTTCLRKFHECICKPAAAGETVREFDLHNDRQRAELYAQKEKVVLASDFDALAARVEELERENTELRELADTHDADFAALDEKWQRECESLRKDAGRYRWLRGRQCGLELDPACEGIVFSVSLPNECKVGMTGADVDAAIDAAMSAANEGGKPCS